MHPDTDADGAQGADPGRGTRDESNSTPVLHPPGAHNPAGEISQAQK